MQSNQAYVFQDQDLRGYPDEPPFSPVEHYPEYPFTKATLASQNGQYAGEVYAAVRELLHGLKLDSDHWGTPTWNPLGEIIKPGHVVTIKPNMVLHFNEFGLDVQSVVTHGSLVRAVVDYVIIALKGKGKIIIGDAPLQSADFDKVNQVNGVRSVVEFYKKQGFDIPLIDFRKKRAVVRQDGSLTEDFEIGGDVNGLFPVNIGKESWHALVAGDHTEKYRVTQYDPDEMKAHHNLDRHEYLISGSILKADVVINMPKMKTHRKVGVTTALKNLVGINGLKDWLPHHKVGSTEEGGDEYLYKSWVKSLRSLMWDVENRYKGSFFARVLHQTQAVIFAFYKSIAKDPYYEGSWYGNDTLWRTALDLNRIMFYADNNGGLKEEMQRIELNIVDGIIAGEGEGPLGPTPKPVGVVVGGCNPVVVDAVVARLMGFDYRKIRLIANGFKFSKYPLVHFDESDIEVFSNRPVWEDLNLSDGGEHLDFTPSRGWQGHIELD